MRPDAGGPQGTDGHSYNICQSKVGRRARFVSQKTQWLQSSVGKGRVPEAVTPRPVREVLVTATPVRSTSHSII